MDFTSLSAIVLAAGRGKRMNAQDLNKVVLPLGNKPMILHGIETLLKLKLGSIVIVVGFAKESVVKALGDIEVDYAIQEEQLGTAHALECGLSKIPKSTKNVLVVQGDDSALYTKELLTNLIEKHTVEGSAITLLTISLNNPDGLGRIIRDENGNITKIVEDKDATDNEKKIAEVNPACYVFTVSFLEKYLKHVGKSLASGEYYLTSLIDSALQHGEKIATLKGENISWRGINTKAELEEAEKIYFSKH